MQTFIAVENAFAHDCDYCDDQEAQEDFLDAWDAAGDAQKAFESGDEEAAKEHLQIVGEKINAAAAKLEADEEIPLAQWRARNSKKLATKFHKLSQ